MFNASLLVHRVILYLPSLLGIPALKNRPAGSSNSDEFD